MGWVQNGWHGITNAGSGFWLASAAWATIALGVIALIVMNRQVKRNHRQAAEQIRPRVAMLMEPHASDWHVIELVVKNFGRTAAYDIRFSGSKAALRWKPRWCWTGTPCPRFSASN